MQASNEIDFMLSEVLFEITVEKERYIWNKYIIDAFFFQKNKCPKCSSISMKLNNNDSIFNPIINRCSSKHFRKICNLRDETFFAKFPKTPISIILIILRNWILENKNSTAIYSIIKNKIKNYDVSQIHINEILYETRIFFSHYLKDKYKLEDITEIRKNEYVAIDESNFNIDNKNLWVIGELIHRQSNYIWKFLLTEQGKL